MGTELDTELDASPILELDEVVAGYGRMTILNGTRFKVARAAITTVVGPNGAGKSTALKAVFGLLPLEQWYVRFDGAEATGLPPRRLLELGVCYIPQGRNVFPELSVRHNLELGGISAPAGFDLQARIDRVMERFPVLRAKARAQACTLSGGQQKLLEIARGLLLDPKLILVDEPSIGLSPIMVEETFGILHDLRANGVSILMVEQNARSALRISDYGIVLELGRTRFEGTANEVLDRLDRFFHPR